MASDPNYYAWPLLGRVCWAAEGGIGKPPSLLALYMMLLSVKHNCDWGMAAGLCISHKLLWVQELVWAYFRVSRGFCRYWCAHEHV